MSKRKSRTARKMRLIVRSRSQKFRGTKKKSKAILKTKQQLARFRRSAEETLDALLDKLEARRRKRLAAKLGKEYVPEAPEKRLSDTPVRPKRKKWRKKR